MGSDDRKAEEMELSRGDYGNTRALFTVNVAEIYSHISRVLWRSLLVFAALYIINLFVLMPILKIDIFDTLFNALGMTDFLTGNLAREVTLERVIFFLIAFSLTALCVYLVMPGSDLFRVAVCNFDKRVFDPLYEIPITHRIGRNRYNGSRRIVLVGENLSYFTYDMVDRLAVMARDVVFTGDEIRIQLVDAHSFNDFEIMAVRYILKRYAVSYSEALREVVAWRSAHVMEAEAVSKEVWASANEKIDPRTKFNAIKLRGSNLERLVPEDDVGESKSAESTDDESGSN